MKTADALRAPGHSLRHRPPLDHTGGRPTTAHDLQLASGIIHRSGVVDVLAPLLDAELGRHRTVTDRGALIACQVKALSRHHHAHLIEVTRVVNAMTDEQRAALGFTKHDPAQTYDRLDRLFLKLATMLEAGHSGVSAKWMANAIANAAIAEEYRQTATVAVDGTDVETWGALHGDVASVDLDGDASATQLPDAPPARRDRSARRRSSGGAATAVTCTPSTATPDDVRRQTPRWSDGGVTASEATSELESNLSEVAVALSPRGRSMPPCSTSSPWPSPPSTGATPRGCSSPRTGR